MKKVRFSQRALIQRVNRKLRHEGERQQPGPGLRPTSASNVSTEEIQMNQGQLMLMEQIRAVLGQCGLQPWEKHEALYTLEGELMPREEPEWPPDYDDDEIATLDTLLDPNTDICDIKCMTIDVHHSRGADHVVLERDENGLWRATAGASTVPNSYLPPPPDADPEFEDEPDADDDERTNNVASVDAALLNRSRN